MEPGPFRGASQDNPSLPCRHDRPTRPGQEPPDIRQSDRFPRSDRRSADAPALQPPAGADAAGRLLNKREVYKQLVVAQLEAGFLRYSRRQSLMGYARQIGISEFDATLLIAEAQFYADQIDPLDAQPHLTEHAYAAGDDPTSPTGSVTYRLMFAAAVALLIDLLLVYWLAG